MKLCNRNVVVWKNGRICFRQQQQQLNRRDEEEENGGWKLSANPVHDDGYVGYYDLINGNEMITSFSNPNYGLDAINSNLFSPPYDEDNDDARFDAENVDTKVVGGSYANPFLELSDETVVQKLNVVAKRSSSSSEKSSTGSLPESDENDDDEDGLQAYRSENYGKASLSEVACIDDGGQDKMLSLNERQSKCNQNNSDTLGKNSILKSESTENGLCRDIYSPDSNDSGIQADVSQSRTSLGSGVNESTATKIEEDGVNEKREESESSSPTQSDDSIGNEKLFFRENDDERRSSSNVQTSDVKTISDEILPYGWQKHEDGAGAYYWHIRSGTIQREPPPFDEYGTAAQTVLKKDQEVDSGVVTVIKGGPTISSSSSRNIFLPDRNSETSSSENKNSSLSLLLPDTAECKEIESGEVVEEDQEVATYPMRFAVRSLGWVQISEEDLTPERSSKSVNKCIVGLSLGKNDLNDVVGRWGDGKSLYMELDEENLVLIDPQDMCILNIQPVQSIRVWGVGRSNSRERDFAYVARDSITRKHMCHVFRCDGLARHIASALRDICKKILAEKSLRFQTSSNLVNLLPTSGGIARPNNLPNLERIRDPPNGQHLTFDSLYKNTSFPTPMEEPKKVLRCHYLGTTQVQRPTGVEILNNAIESVYMRLPPDKWTYVNVAVAPSTITITEHGKSDNVFAECRVRFLSFMGIAMNNVRLCSFIMHCAQDHFVAHIFHCDPSAGALCKTIEAACKLRYQKCLDAHHKCHSYQKNPNPERPVKSLGVSIKSGIQTMIGNLTKGCKPKS